MNERLDWIEDNTSLFIHKISNEEKLDEHEVRTLVYGNYNHARILKVDDVVVDEGRWTSQIMIVFSIPELKKNYAIYYDRALTELQEDEFWEQVACEVEPITVTKTEWREVK